MMIKVQFDVGISGCECICIIFSYLSVFLMFVHYIFVFVRISHVFELSDHEAQGERPRSSIVIL